MPGENQDTQINEPVNNDDLYQAYDQLEQGGNADELNIDNSTNDVTESDDQAESNQSEELKAPEHWSEDDRNLFDNQPDNVKEYLLRRHKEMEGDYTRKSQARANDLKLAEGLYTALEPYRQDFESQGVDEVGAIKALLDAHARLKANPAEGLMWLAQQYGYNPDVHTKNTGNEQSYDSNDYDSAYVDPEFQNMQRKIVSLENELNRQKAQQQNSAQQSFSNKLSDFVNATDDNGDSINPYAGELRRDIIHLMQVGAAKDLNSAYRMAIASKPDIQNKVTDYQREQQQKQEKIKKQEAASRAKKAAIGVKGSSSQNVNQKPVSLRAELHQIYDELAKG